MIKAIEEITVNEGVNPRESILVAGGGAAGLNILPIADALGCRQVLLPKTAGALSACGAQYSDVVAEFSASQYVRTDHWDNALVEEPLPILIAKWRPSLPAFAGAASSNSTSSISLTPAISISNGKRK
jgi:N-methylhydantoinase A